MRRKEKTEQDCVILFGIFLFDFKPLIKLVLIIIDILFIRDIILRKKAI